MFHPTAYLGVWASDSVNEIQVEPRAPGATPTSGLGTWRRPRSARPRSEAMARWLGENPVEAPSLRDVRPVDLGPMLQPFDRSELADEMYQR